MLTVCYCFIKIIYFSSSASQVYFILYQNGNLAESRTSSWDIMHFGQICGKKMREIFLQVPWLGFYYMITVSILEESTVRSGSNCLSIVTSLKSHGTQNMGLNKSIINPPHVGMSWHIEYSPEKLCY